MAQQDPQWCQTGWGRKVQGQDALMLAIGRVGTLNTGRRYVWRGVPNWRYRLRSSLSRLLVDDFAAVGQEMPIEEQVRAHEEAVLEQARLWKIGIRLGALNTDLHLLTMLQHHGVPTRLLDVTTNPMTALWFACQRAGDRDSTGALFAFDITDLPEYETAEPGSATWGSVGDPWGWTLRHALEVSAAEQEAFLVRPSLPDDRMTAQEGLFISAAVPTSNIVSGVDGIPLGAAAAPDPRAFDQLLAPAARGQGRPRTLPFLVLAIPPTVKTKMLVHLENSYNRTERVLFPDISGLATAIRRENELE